MQETSTFDPNVLAFLAVTHLLLNHFSLILSTNASLSFFQRLGKPLSSP